MVSKGRHFQEEEHWESKGIGVVGRPMRCLWCRRVQLEGGVGLGRGLRASQQSENQAGVSSIPSQWETQDEGTEQGRVRDRGSQDPEASTEQTSGSTGEAEAPATLWPETVPSGGLLLLAVLSSDWGSWFLGRWRKKGPRAGL